MNFSSKMFKDTNRGFRAAILNENPLRLLPLYMAVATSCYYEKVRRTIRSVIVSHLLNTLFRSLLIQNWFLLLLFIIKMTPW